MCGVIVCVGNIGLKEKAIFKEALEVGMLRGRHSTGVIKVTRDGAVETKKKAVNGADFVALNDKWLCEGDSRLLIGHNRHATMGKVTDANAHPFSCNGIHAVHNGTLTTKSLLLDGSKFDVDSEAMVHHIGHKGLRDTFPLLSGAFTVPMYDENTKLFQLFRNGERPLACAVSASKGVVWYMSEFHMLEWLLERNDYKTMSVFRIKPDILITINPFDIICYEGISVKNVEFRKTNPSVFPSLVRSNDKITFADQQVAEDAVLLDEDSDDDWILPDEDVVSYDKDKMLLDDVILFDDGGTDELYVCEDRNGLAMTWAEWTHTDVCKHGCAVCGDVVLPDSEFMWHVDGSNAFCEECKTYSGEFR